MKIVFRTNAGSNSGLGHLNRCISLALALTQKANDIEIIFVINEEAKIFLANYNFNIQVSATFDALDIEKIKHINPNVIIFDSYRASSEYLNELRQISFLIMFDDNNDIYGEIVANILINGNAHTGQLCYKSKLGDTKFLLGHKYLVMRPEYWANNENIVLPKGVLITTGGCDSQNLMYKFVTALKTLSVKKKIILGKSYLDYEIKELEEITKNDDNYELIYKPDSLKEYINSSEVIISAAGSTIYEILALKKLPIIYEVSDDQKGICSILESQGVMSLGWHENIAWDNISHIVGDSLKNKNNYFNKIQKKFDEFDSKGAIRVADFIMEYMKEKA